jgi:glycerophosphoryl diester phosphodiesterase
MVQGAFEIQGHRGARGLAPENTLVGFERALDLGVSAMETDLHLSADGAIVLFHDAQLTAQLCSIRPGHCATALAGTPLVRQLRLDELRGYRIDRNPDPSRFPAQDGAVTPLAQWFADKYGLDPLGIPTLVELFAFSADFAGEPGRRADKTLAQRRRASQVRFDLELKRVPFFPETIGDAFDGTAAGLLERRVVEMVRAAGVLARTSVRSFDHRCLLAIKKLEPGMRTAVLIAEMAPVDPEALTEAAGAETYCPDYRFLDAALVRAVKTGGKRIVPWTVNRAADWERLIAWGVDGLTTDFPDALLAWLRQRGLAVL